MVMEAEQVIQKILSDAKAEAEKIKKQAGEKQAEEKAKLNAELRQFKEQSDALAEKAARDTEAHILSAARMKIAKDNLAEKTKILDEVFEQAKQQLQKLPDGDYRNLMIKLMAEAAETGDEQVIIGKNEKRIDQSLIDEVNSKLGPKGLPATAGKLRPAEQRSDIAGGFILSRGKIKNNVSLDVILAQAREQIDIELAKELFAE